MKTLQEMIKDLTNITVEEKQIKKYLENEELNLSGANIKRADLRYADLSDANLRYANLSCANLFDANLSGVKITKEQLKQLIIVDDLTEWD